MGRTRGRSVLRPAREQQEWRRSGGKEPIVLREEVRKVARARGFRASRGLNIVLK